jgi:phosphoglycolate phosphatase
MAPCKHIIWDWNGTLLDDLQACVDAINILLARRHLPAVTVQQYLDVFDFPVRNYYLKLGFDFSRDNWDAVAVEYHAAYATTSLASPLRQGVKATLNTLKAHNIGVSILSACELGLLKRMLKERGIIHYFEHIYGLNDLYASSKVDLGHSLLKKSGLPRANTLMVGDTTHDHEVAQAMGIPCLLMTGGHQSEAKLTALHSPIATTLDDVLRYILKQP